MVTRLEPARDEFSHKDERSLPVSGNGLAIARKANRLKPMPRELADPGPISIVLCNECGRAR